MATTISHKDDTAVGVDVDTALLLDRLVSASSSDDVMDSLQQIVQGRQRGTIAAKEVVVLNNNNNNDDKEQRRAVLTALLQLLAKPTEAQALAARVYLSLLQQQPKQPNHRIDDEDDDDDDVTEILLQEPSPGRLLEACIDVAADPSGSAYPRVLCLQLLRQLCSPTTTSGTAARTSSKARAQPQLLAAPNGLHRLADLLQDPEEQVRNEALRLAAVLCEWPPVAKLWMFAEVGDVVTELALTEGGLTGGNVLVRDCLQLLRQMLRHDAALADLVFQSPVLVPNLARLLDLRQARAFLVPQTRTVDNGSRMANDNDDDDLDDLLNHGAPSQTKKQGKPPPAPPVPYLSEAEEQVVHGVFDILETVLQNETVRQHVWKKHAPLGSLVWEMALLSAPPPGAPWNCGVIRGKLQRRALRIVALYLNGADFLQYHVHQGLDRLLYLVCTAGGRWSTLEGGESTTSTASSSSSSSSTWKEALALSQSALHVIRRTLPEAVANEMLMHTLAPPMHPSEPDDDDNNNATSPPPPPTVIQKLLNTALEQLQPDGPSHPDVAKQKLLLVGSLSALGLFLTDEPRRSIFLKITNTRQPSLLDTVLQCLLNETKETSDSLVPLHLLKFLGQWITEAPLVAQAFWRSPHSTAVALLYNSNNNNTAVSALTGLVLGLAWQNMGPDETQCGGWTSAGILQLLQQQGMANLWQQLEALSSNQELPWNGSPLEWTIWQQWCDTAVWTVRKRVVHALTTSSLSDTATTTTTGTTSMENADDATAQTIQAMQSLVAEQAREMEELRTNLVQAQRTVALQEKELETWQKRVESTPTELDEMLNEWSGKNTALERQLGALQDEQRVVVERYDKELAARDETIASLQEELTKSQSAETEARQECDTLRGDMEALSQAYASLEEEYQRLQLQQQRQHVDGSDHAGTPAGEPAGSEEAQQQQQQQQQQSQGEESNQSGGSTEVATLRAENARLRNDAEAADDWMRMAVERMTAMGVEQATLQQTVAALQAQLEQAKAAAMASGDQVAQQLAQETETRVRLEQELAQKTQSLTEEWDYREQLQQQLESMQAHTESLENERNRLEHELADLRNSTNANESSHLESLQKELSRVREELEMLQEQHKEELTRRDARIGELELAQVSGEGIGYEDALRARDEEIAQLQEANDAAQDWMNNAVEHHQVLANQMAVLTQQNGELLTRVQELEAQLQSRDSAAESAVPMEQTHEQLQQRETEIDRLQQTLSLREEELRQFAEAQADALAQLEKDVSEKHALVESIRAASVVKDQEIELLRGRMESSNLGDDFVGVAEQESQLAEQTEQLKLLEEEVNELRSENEMLLHKIADFEASKVEFGTTEEEIEALRVRAAEVEARNASIEKLLEAVGREKKELEVESQKNREALEIIERDLYQLRAGDLDTSTHTEYDEKVSEMLDTIKNLEMRLVDQQEEASGVIQQWEETYSALQTEKSEMEVKLQEALVEKDKLSADLEESLNALQNVQAQLDAAKSANDRVGELESTIRSLEEQLTEHGQEAQEAVVQWQESYSELESEYNTLHEEKESISSQLQVLQSETDNKVSELERKIKNLEDRLTDQEQDTARIEDQWQESYDELEQEKSKITQQLDSARASLRELEVQLAQAEESRVNGAAATELVGSNVIESSVNERTSSFGASEAILEEKVTNQWQGRYNALALEKDAVSQQLEETQAALELLRANIHNTSSADTIPERQLAAPTVEASDSLVAESSSEIYELKCTIQDLQQQLDDQEQEANSAVEQWQQSHEEISLELQECLAALETAKSMESEASKLKEEVEELRSTVQELEEKLRERDELSSSTPLAENDQDYNEISSQLLSCEEELAKLRVQYDEAVAGSVAKSSELDRLTNLVRQLEDNILNLEEQLKDQEDEANNNAAMWQESYERVSAQLKTAEVENAALLAKLDQEKESACAEVVAGFDSKVQELEEQLRQQEEDACNAIMQWQESYSAVSNQLSAAQVELAEARESLSRVQHALDIVNTSAADTAVEGDDSAARVLELESKVAALEDRLKVSQENTSRLEAACKESELLSTSLQVALHSREGIAALEQELKERRTEMEATEDQLQESQDQLNQTGASVSLFGQEVSYVVRVSELESMVEDLQVQLASNEEEAKEVVSQWEESYYAIIAEKEDLAADLINAQDSLAEARNLLESQAQPTHQDSAEKHAWDDKVEELTILLDRTMQEKKMLEKQVEELRSDITVRKSQIEELHQRVANPTDANPRQASSIVTALESRISAHMEKNHRLESELLQQKEEKRLLQQQLADAEERFHSQIESSATDLARVKESLYAESLGDQEKLKIIEREMDEMQLNQATIERERDDLRAQVAGLEDELRVLNDALQLHLTNEVSDAASDLAATLLREQIHEMRAHAHETERALSSERKAREIVEAEVEQLRADLAALLGIENLDENSSEMQQRVMQATENFQRKERSEIVSLRNSLARALEELSAARATEKQVEERAAKAIHQVALYEQEIVSAKGEFKFLMKTLDEMREAESTRRAALGHRISTLENEQNVQRRCHAAEMENLQNELSQVNMERDRLFQALKKSEKTKEALIHASSHDLHTGGDADSYTELTRLQLERVQLLTAAEEEASRVERRLRETRAAARAAAEAEIILERELRMNAEKSMESIKIELEEMKAARDCHEANENDSNEEQFERLQKELEMLTEANDVLTKECEVLREQMKTVEKESRMAIERLSEECNQAKARASHLEREGRYEAEVRAEMARLQAPLCTSRTVVVNPAVDDEQEDQIAVTKLYDVIRKQKQAIDDERAVYFELLAEHDDLLAQYAQQDLLKASLKNALSREVGHDAVEAAIREAEENAEAQYGRFIKLT